MAEFIGDVARGVVTSALQAAENESEALIKITRALQEIGLGVNDIMVTWSGMYHTATMKVARPNVTEPFPLEVSVAAGKGKP
jgi:hypothetical protein